MTCVSLDAVCDEDEVMVVLSSLAGSSAAATGATPTRANATRATMSILSKQIPDGTFACRDDKTCADAPARYQPKHAGRQP